MWVCYLMFWCHLCPVQPCPACPALSSSALPASQPVLFFPLRGGFRSFVCLFFWLIKAYFPPAIGSSLSSIHPILDITSALSRVLAQCILPSSMLHLRCDCLSPVLYQRSLPSLYLLHSPCRLCEVLPLYVCMSERFSLLLSLPVISDPRWNLHCLSVCSLPYDLQPVPDSDSLPPAST